MSEPSYETDNETGVGQTPRNIFWHLLAGLFVAVLAGLAINLASVADSRFSAYESEYLLTARSLSEDLDLDIADEIAALTPNETGSIPTTQEPSGPQISVDRSEFAALPVLSLEASPNTRIQDEPVLPFILAAPTSIGGWFAARGVMVLTLAATAAFTSWLLASRFQLHPWRSALVAATTFASPPTVFYGTQIHSAAPAALAVAIALTSITSTRVRPFVAWFAIALLPWLAIYYLAAAVGLAIWLLSRAKTAPVRIVIAASLAASFVFRIFKADPVDLLTSDIERSPLKLALSAIALLVDAEMGVALWAPLMLIVPALFGWYWARAMAHRVAVTVTSALIVLGACWFAPDQVFGPALLVPGAALATIVIGVAARKSAVMFIAVLALNTVSIATWLHVVSTISSDGGFYNSIQDVMTQGLGDHWPIHRIWSPLLADVEIDLSLKTLSWIAALALSVVAAYLIGVKQKRALVNQSGPSDKFGNRNRSLYTLDDDLGADLEDIIEP